MTVIRFTSMPEFSTLVVRSYLAADVTYNNTAALANTALSVTVEAGKKYEIRLQLNSESATNPLNLDFGGTATFTNFEGSWSATRENDPTTADRVRVTAAGTDFTPPSVGGMTSVYEFVGSAEVNAGGTFILRGAQSAAHASNTTIHRGATLILTLMD